MQSFLGQHFRHFSREHTTIKLVLFPMSYIDWWKVLPIRFLTQTENASQRHFRDTSQKLGGYVDVCWFFYSRVACRLTNWLVAFRDVCGLQLKNRQPDILIAVLLQTSTRTSSDSDIELLPISDKFSVVIQSILVQHFGFIERINRIARTFHGWWFWLLRIKCLGSAACRKRQVKVLWCTEHTFWFYHIGRAWD